MQSYPLHSLIRGSWFKLICGASYQHLPVVRNLALAYSLAGADCIDVAADPAVIAAAQEGITAAQQSNTSNKSNQLPWLMVSINDGEDPHFRKAHFDVAQCPTECPQPCVQVCPAAAIDLSSGGVIEPLCYGCGRCLPICPQQLIVTDSRQSSIDEVVKWIKSMKIDAIEIHTQVGHYDNFKQVWHGILPIIDQLKLLAISCTDAPDVIEYLRSLSALISPLPCPLVWQTDGRSMSGDIGKGTTHAAIAFARKLISSQLPGYVQLAGGTNNYTVDKLRELNLLQQSNTPGVKAVSGVAYGSYARGILSPILNKLEMAQLQPIQSNSFTTGTMNQLNLKLEQDQKALDLAVATASKLVNQVKQPQALR
ncbi:MAG: LdpA C-terminal domain-containing domain [Cyanobacteria bacterium P01_A01_bin.83]